MLKMNSAFGSHKKGLAPFRGQVLLILISTKASALKDFSQKASAFYCFGRACRGACAAIRAFGCIDDVNGIALADRFNRAFRDACPAGYTSIGNNMWHRILLLK
jgi:hypothetical protein